MNDGDCSHAHPLLYHYTSEEGLRGIIESNALWATYFADLNDSQEIMELRKPLIAELTDAFVPLVKEIRKRGLRENALVSKFGGNIRTAGQIAKDWVDALYTSTFEVDEAERQAFCCITSFCSHAQDQVYEQKNGLLSQWRGYGGAGGYCLVFETAKLQQLMMAEREAYFLLHLDLRPAFYFSDGRSVAPLFSELFDQSRRIVGELFAGSTKISGEQIFAPFVTAATTTKHRGFYEEREIRLVTVAGTQAADDAIKYKAGYKQMSLKEQFTTRLSSGRIRHHISLFGKDAPPLPIRRVLVGPSRNQDDNAIIARKIVGSRIQIEKSDTPFIG